MDKTSRRPSREPLRFLVAPLMEGATARGALPVVAANYREAAAVGARLLDLMPGPHRVIVQSLESGEEMVVQLIGEEAVVWRIETVHYLSQDAAMQ